MWCVKLSDSQRDALRALVREQARAGPRWRPRSRRSSWRAGTTCPTPRSRGSAWPSSPRSRGSARPTWSGTSPAECRRRRPSARRAQDRAREAREAAGLALRRVVVEAGAGLPAQLALGDQLAHAVGHLGADRLADRGGHVETHEVEQRRAVPSGGRRRASCRCRSPRARGRRARAAARRRRGRGTAAC